MTAQTLKTMASRGFTRRRRSRETYWHERRRLRARVPLSGRRRCAQHDSRDASLLSNSTKRWWPSGRGGLQPHQQTRGDRGSRRPARSRDQRSDRRADYTVQRRRRALEVAADAAARGRTSRRGRCICISPTSGCSKPDAGICGVPPLAKQIRRAMGGIAMGTVIPSARPRRRTREENRSDAQCDNAARRGQQHPGLPAVRLGGVRRRITPSSSSQSVHEPGQDLSVSNQKVGMIRSAGR